jgi:hypothetical protein
MKLTIDAITHSSTPSIGCIHSYDANGLIVDHVALALCLTLAIARFKAARALDLRGAALQYTGKLGSKCFESKLYET